MSTEFTRIRVWAHARNLIEGSDNKSQFLKLLEEIGELSHAIQKNDEAEFIDAVGDVIVVLTIMAAQRNVTTEQCIDAAWEQIKDRKGKMVNGVFVKEA
jgi:NTP pyrophosphatase (non-canonical NTP hydrolase)